LIPAFNAAGAQLHTILTKGGVSGVIHEERAGFAKASTDFEGMLNDQEINTLAIATRHDTHARFVVQALQKGKHVFVEKPLCLTLEELEEIEKAYTTSRTKSSAPLLMVGYNRRFSPHIQKIKALLQSVNEPKSFIMTMNAGMIPADHWTQDNCVCWGLPIDRSAPFIIWPTAPPVFPKNASRFLQPDGCCNWIISAG
jgi:predicted dehydrogenase